MSEAIARLRKIRCSGMVTLLTPQGPNAVGSVVLEKAIDAILDGRSILFCWTHSNQADGTLMCRGDDAMPGDCVVTAAVVAALGGGDA